MSLVARKAEKDNGPSVLYDDAVVLSGHSGAVFSVKFSADGNHIASAGLDRSIRLWNFPTLAEDEVPNYGLLESHKGGVTALSWVSENQLFSTSADSTVAFWDTETGQKVRTGKGHELTINDCATIFPGTGLSVGDDGTIRVWDEREKLQVKKIDTAYPILACDLSSDGKVAFVSGVDPTIRAYDLSLGKEMWNCVCSLETTTGLALSSDESMLVLRSMDGSVNTMNAKMAVPQGVSRRGQIYDGALGGSQMLLSRARFSRDDVYICLGSDDFLVTMWSTASRRLILKFPGHEAAVIDVDFHPSQKVLASCAVDGDIIVREY